MAKASTKTVERTPVTSSADSDMEFLKELAGVVNDKLKTDSIIIGESASDTGVPYWVRTGVPALDFAVGGKSHPGFPGARIIEAFGAEGTGKSTLAVLLMMKAMEQFDCLAYYQDAERVLTPEIIKGTGININKVMRDQPETLEEVFDAQIAVLEKIKEKFPDRAVVVGMDSIAACSTKSEIEGDMDDQQYAPHAKLMSKGLRKIKGLITDTKVLSIWVNQTREKIGVTWGDSTSTFGGKAMAFYASVRLQLARIKTHTNSKKEPIGCRIQVVVKKNKVAPPLKKVEYDIQFIEDENGSYPRINTEMAIIEWLEEHNLIEHNAQRVTIEGKSLYREQACKMLRDDPGLYQKYYDLAYSVASLEDDENEDEAE